MIYLRGVTRRQSVATSSWRADESESKKSRRPAYDVSKRALDLVFGASLIALLSPFFLTIAILVRASGPGPVLFRQRRLRQGGRQFRCLKFRTMVQNAEEVLRSRPELQKEFQESFKLKDDPRITRVGKLLRKSSLDELPQLFNVLAGDLSLIGPRPIVPEELDKYGACAEKFLSVKPGLGGMWQVFGRNDTTYEDRIRLDMDYVDRRSIRLDIWLLFMTAYAVMRRKGAY